MISKVKNLKTTRLLEIKNLFKKIDGKEILSDVNFELPNGAVLGVIGPNGAGKTTLFRLVSGLIVPDRGKIFWDGDIIFNQLRNVGYCPQTPVFWKFLTASEQFYFCADLYGMKREETKTRLNFLFTQVGLDIYRNVRAEHLSGGLQKRLNILLSIAHKPKLLLLDEPSANLDWESKEHIKKLIQFLIEEEGVTILYSTHDLNEIQKLASHILVLKEGHIRYFEDQNLNHRSENKNDSLQNLYEKIIVHNKNPND